MSDLATIITAAGTALTVIGGGFAWIWNKVEGRFIKIENDLNDCHEKHQTSIERRAKQLVVIELLWAALQEIAPASKVFDRAKKLLAELQPQEDD